MCGLWYQIQKAETKLDFGLCYYINLEHSTQHLHYMHNNEKILNNRLNGLCKFIYACPLKGMKKKKKKPKKQTTIILI